LIDPLREEILGQDGKLLQLSAAVARAASRISARECRQAAGRGQSGCVLFSHANGFVSVLVFLL